MSDASGVDNSHVENPYGYLPTFAVCTTFIVLFGLSSFLHTVQAIWTRHWYFLFTAVLCGLLETLGWSARLWSNRNLQNNQAFTIQISTLIIGPTFLLASIFKIFGDLVISLGSQYSRLKPSLYAKIFFSCDIISLVLQGIGGGMASSASDNGTDIQPGTNIILVGIALQIVIILTFATLASEFMYRYMTDRPLSRFTKNGSQATLTRDVGRDTLDGKKKVVLSAVVVSTICLFARAIYRMVELGEGWNGAVMRTQWLFGFLDSGVVCLAMYIWNIAHPGWFLRPTILNEKKDVETI